MITQPKERSVEILASFVWNREPTKVGTRIVLPNGFAHEMRHAQKVKFVDPDPVPVKTEPDQSPNSIPKQIKEK